MIIDPSFKEAISETFYDKEIVLCEKVVTQEDDGQVREEFVLTNDSFFGNTRFNNLARVQEDYGIKEEIDIVITTNEEVPNGTICKYLERYFELVKVIPFDSHNLLIGKQWLYEPSTSISV